MNYKLILFTLFVVTFSSAQENMRANRITAELTEVMSLSSEESAQLLDLNIDRFNKREQLKIDFLDDNQGFKEAIRAVEKDYNKKLRKLVGQEKFNLLIEYRKRKKNKTSEKN